MKRYFSKYSLRNKLLLAFVGLAIIPTLFIGAFLFVRLQQDTARTVYHSLQSGLEQSCDALGARWMSCPCRTENRKRC